MLWQYGGYTGPEEIEHLVGSLEGRSAIVVGNGVDVFYELLCALRDIENPVIFVVNDIGMFIDHCDHWVSLHPASLLAWRAVREKGHRELPQFHSINDSDKSLCDWSGVYPKFIPGRIYSGYLAMHIAYLMGADRITLCGIPGNRQRRFFDMYPPVKDYGGGEGSDDVYFKEQLDFEMERVPAFREKIRSYSGWTASYFGSA